MKNTENIISWLLTLMILRYRSVNDVMYKVSTAQSK